ncbi:MAG: hypothetical protein K2P53_03665 [Rickettsiales bacterium]|nr:hypothetical protein [Rickettsiales bacterium]
MIWTHSKCNRLDTEYNLLQLSRSLRHCVSCTKSVFPFTDVPDNEFKLLFSSDTILITDDLPPSINLFPSSHLNKVSTQINDYVSSRVSNSDDEIHASINIVCKYYDISKFCSLNFDKTTALSLFHLNISSLQKHFEELNVLLSLMSFELSIIGITETRLKKETPSIHPIFIDNYNIEHTPTESSCGGTLLYLSKKLIYKRRDDLMIYTPYCLESTFVEIIFSKKTNIIVGCIYKHPCMDTNDFTSIMSALLQKINSENKSVFLLGDYNIDLIQSNNDTATSDFLNLLSFHNIHPFITLPTRITNHSATIIDNIFSNLITNEIISGNLTTSVSDHLPQFCIFPNFNKLFIPRNHNLYRRNFKNFDKIKFTSDLLKIDWDNVIENSDVNSCFQMFISETTLILDNYAPLKKISIKNFKRRFKPWITKGILKSIQIRNLFQKKMLRSKDIRNINTFKTTFMQYKYMIITLIKLSKKMHFKSFFTENVKNLREIWKGINNLINVKSSNHSSPNCLQDNDNEIYITEPYLISEKFNTFFTNVAQKLKSNIHSSYINYTKYLKYPNLHSLLLSPTNSLEVSSLISKLKPRKSIGPNSIPTNILIDFNSEFSNILSKLFNKSFINGTFPNLLKLSCVIPIFKNGSKLLCTNYRPISLLSNISKLLEKLMYSRVYSFLNSFNCLNEFQFGFRSKHSTCHALISITEKIRKALDNSNFVCGIFIDLQKAFDTVDHNILISKLKHYGIRGIVNDWFRSYLTDRKQFVSINGYNSTNKSVVCGVPQGSVLGPLLFLIYINDINNSIRFSSIHLFADDTNLLHINNSYTSLCKNINSDLKGIVHWLNANLICLNAKKTELIFFSTSRKKHNLNNNSKIQIKINNKRLYPTKVIKYLGVLIDCNLSWNFHIDELRKKLTRANGALSIIRHYVDNFTLKNIYYALFLSHLSYCCQIWGQNGNYHIKKLMSTQRQSIRIINFQPFKSETSESFKKLKIPTFPALVKFSNLLFVFDSLNKNLPSSITHFFTESRIIHTYSTRNINNGKLSVPPFKTQKYGKNSVIYQCICEWNKSLVCIVNEFKKLQLQTPLSSFLYLKQNQFKKILRTILF